MRQRIIKALLCTVLAMVSFTANAQVKAFEKYADMKNVSYVYISKYMLGMAGKVATPAAIPGVDIRALASKLTGIQIITAEETTVRKKLKNDDRRSSRNFREEGPAVFMSRTALFLPAGAFSAGR